MLRRALLDLREQCPFSYELIVVDGGSRDGTIEIAEKHADNLVVLKPGRAIQMNAGANLASGEFVLFLHADTTIPPAALRALQNAIKSQDISWGYFSIQLESDKILLRMVSILMNWRSRTTRVATGDQCLFFRRSVFRVQNGFAEIPLMEDIEICKRLRAKSMPTIISKSVMTSARRWEENGVFRTIFLMWRLRLYYYFGVSPERLHRAYYKTS